MINMLHKAIKGYEDYLVSDDGRVYSLKTGKYLKPSVIKAGYYVVSLCKNGVPTKVYVHRLVSEAFIPNPDNKPTVDHVNRNRKDNRVENLRWASQKEQTENRDPLMNKKDKGTVLVEKINDEVSLGYLAMRNVKGIHNSSFQYHLQQGKSHFYCKGREFYTEPKTN